MSKHLIVVDLLDDNDCEDIVAKAREFGHNTPHDWMQAIIAKSKDYQTTLDERTAKRVIRSIVRMGLASMLSADEATFAD